MSQATWTQLTPATSILPFRAGHVAGTDGSTLYVFGGNAGTVNGMQNDLWAYAGGTWTQLTPAGGPPAIRQFHSGAFDTARNRLVVFGGIDASSTYFGDTWEWDQASNTWTQLTPAHSPLARRWAAMAYDPANQRCILFGGNNNTTYYNDTWSWDGTDWTQLTPATSPSIRGRGLFSVDPTRGQMVYFGGRNGTAAIGETWIWDYVAGNWSQVTTATVPGAGLFAYGCTYDLLRDRHVIFGGTHSSATLATTYEFDGTNWVQRAVSGPVSRTGCSLNFVPALGTNILWGGFQTSQLGDTWQYQTSVFPSVTPYGAACHGLSLAPASDPWTGSTFTATCSGFGPASLGLILIGVGPAGQFLPGIPLVVVPVPGPGAGCSVYANNDAMDVMNPPLSSMQSYSLVIPDVSSLAGVDLYLQTVELDFSSGGWGSTYASNGLAVILGAR